MGNQKTNQRHFALDDRKIQRTSDLMIRRSFDFFRSINDCPSEKFQAPLKKWHNQ
jgi:hypothetical protein